MSATTPDQIQPDERFLPVIDGIGLAAGAANVIMQLSWPGVGYGVYESRVESGRLFDHPIKRTRTTLTYLAVAARGTDEEKKAYRRAVGRSHAQVHSTEDSPVEYNAFDPELQRWVAACLYRGFEDVYTFLHGPLPAGELARSYQLGATFGTTLQMKRDMWPEDREAFEVYWKESLAKVSIDDTIREHLTAIARGEFLGPALARVVEPVNMFFTKGFLPQEFLDEMHFDWTPAQQRRFERVMKAIGAVSRRLPVVVRELPYRYLLRDLRWRMRTGRPLV
ncbi:oxygenase MpaB family protein [Rhodococcus sp. HNM0569]|uniref:oxygenase MpaB family protein n=1 Tax=Rhodococcus sp. HNM0569 TaxID=2716340 RepID=UPI00146CE5EB|nr:oxygenase MpaB family protein [Rhodococcus sp. HNM0569]NLU84831.1 DUF2236 domain-containing protein [Rhodococcus sp. HNM0569]